ncbi:hypothetical protein ABEX53_17275 [Bacillus toyonensis]|nr:hypothetical protein [Bacillus toyonensis]MED3538281.1 hypothetical protein [Bacillus toyonensis]MEE2017017.1 hypothetical protein [Bacillus toyonensis]
MNMKTKIENIIWHINTNRKILGDTRTLEDVLIALQRIAEDTEG